MGRPLDRHRWELQLSSPGEESTNGSFWSLSHALRTWQWTEAIATSDLGPVEVGGCLLPRPHPTAHCRSPRPPAWWGAQKPERLSSPGAWSTYPLGASSQLKGSLLTVVLTVFQLLQDPVQHHRPLFLRGLCGSPDGKRGEKNSGEGWGAVGKMAWRGRARTGAGRAGWAVSRGAAGERRGERQEERARIGRSGREGGRAGEGMRGGGQHRQPRFSCLCCSAGIPAPTSSVFRLERAPVRKGWGREEGCLPAAEVNGSLPGVGRAGNLPRG